MAKCYICPSQNHVDDHHIDCKEGKLSPETVPLCRRCHRTYHDFGVDWFEDEYLDKAIEIENKFRVIHNANLKESVNHKYIDGLYSKELQLMKREDIRRSDYWCKKHGIKRERPLPKKGKVFSGFQFPHGEPLCGQQWVSDHLYDLIDWVPRIEVTGPGLELAMDVDSSKKLREAVKVLRGMKG